MNQPSTPVPWTPRDVWLGVGSFALWVVLFGALRLLVDYFSLTFDAGLLVSLGELLLLLPVWWLAVHKYGVAWSALGLRPFATAMVGTGCRLMFGSFLFNFVYGSLLAFFGLRMQVDLVPIFQEVASPWLLFLGGAVIAPIVEEIFFRGFLFAGLRSHYGWQKAAVISSAIFAVLHLTPTAILPIFILGYIFAYLYHRSDSIWPAILMHVLTNTLALGAAYLASTGQFDLM